jgi:hypothetical protein
MIPLLTVAIVAFFWTLIVGGLCFTAGVNRGAYEERQWREWRDRREEKEKPIDREPADWWKN